MSGNLLLNLKKDNQFKNIINLHPITPILIIRIIKLEICHPRKKDKKLIIMEKKHF
jgi:hypothetical protein